MGVKYLFASLLFVAVLALTGATASAQVGSEKSLRGLKGLDVVVEDADKLDAADGLNEKLIREVVGKKLGEGGIKVLTEAEDAPGDPYLQVELSVLKEKDGTALVTILLKLKQEVVLERDSSIELSAITWMDSQLVTTATSELSKSVREKLALMVEKFNSDYKDENQAAADSTQKPPAK